MDEPVEVVVVGGGVSGLNLLRNLSEAGISCRLLEARGRLGGRVLTVDAEGEPSADGFDLGPSWYWPRLQPTIARLVDELKLDAFAQSSDGDVVFERMSREPAGRYTGVGSSAETMRLSGGSAALVRALSDKVVAEAIGLNSLVTGLSLETHGVDVIFRDAQGSEQSLRSRFVAFCLPPRLLEATITFNPEPETATSALWRDTPTWMAGQAKFFALYDTPFWREDGLSGTAQSMVGPMLEIHDATTESGRPALFGFLGIGPGERQSMGEEAIKEACLAQFTRLFGPQAGTPEATLFKDWAFDEFTATAQDVASSGHPAPSASWVQGAWADRIVLAGSEVSPAEAGYLAGAIEASDLAAEDLRSRLGR